MFKWLAKLIHGKHIELTTFEKKSNQELFLQGVTIDWALSPVPYFKRGDESFIYPHDFWRFYNENNFPTFSNGEKIPLKIDPPVLCKYDYKLGFHPINIGVSDGTT